MLAVGVVVLDNAKISIDVYNKAYVDMLLAAGFWVTNAYTDTDSVTYRITKESHYYIPHEELEQQIEDITQILKTTFSRLLKLPQRSPIF